MSQEIVYIRLVLQTAQDAVGHFLRGLEAKAMSSTGTAMAKVMPEFLDL